MSHPDGTLPLWSRAYGEPLLAATIRGQPSDFQVIEELRIELSGAGEHDYLWVEKTGSNTDWVARQLARHARVRAVDIGYAGRKDRHAITRQWFSVLRKGRGADWTAFACKGARVLEIGRHARKLKLGSHSGNRFRIALRTSGVPTRRERIDKRLTRIASLGVPNYFGPQRFGRGGSNLALAKRLFAGERLRRNERSIAISAARSLLFNEILTARVAADNWNRILPGELANLDGSNSVFDVAVPDETIERRCVELDIHPTGSLFGADGMVPSGDVAELEQRVADAHAVLVEGLDRVGAKRSQRPLRLRVIELEWEFDENVLWLDFRLRKGGFATAVLDEIASVQTSLSST